MAFLSRWVSLAALLFVSPAFSEIQSFGDFSGGLNTYKSPVLLQDNESPNLQNVVLDESGAITKRKGFSKLNSSAIGGGISDVQAVYKLEQSGGNKYCVAFSSTSAYWSNDGCQTFTVFISTLTRNNDVNCDAYGDNLYCVSNGYNFRFDGTNDTPVGGMPSSMKYIKVFRNRCFAAGGTSPSRLYWSNLGDCNTWTTNIDYVDIDAEDGDVITGLGEPLFNFLPVYKKYSSNLLQFDNANTANRKIINISRSIGAANHRSIANFQNRQFFASLGQNGGQPGIYATDGINIDEASLKIRPSISGLSTSFASSGRKTLDTQVDWEAGNLQIMGPESPLSSTVIPGFLTLSSSTNIDTQASDFQQFSASSSISTATIPGSVTPIVSSMTFPFANHLNNWDFTTNTIANGSWRIYPTQTSCSPISGYSGEWVSYPTGYTCADVTSQPKDLIVTIETSSGVLIASTTYSNDYFQGGASCSTQTMHIDDAVWAQYQASNVRVKFDVSGCLSAPCSKTSNVFSSPLRGGLGQNFSWHQQLGDGLDGQSSNSCVYKFTINQSTAYALSGSYTSRIFDTQFSTPTFGLFQVTMSSNAESALTFKVQASSASDGSAFETLASQSVDAEIVAAKRRYLRYQATFTNAVSTKTAILNDVTATAVTTGTWQSNELFLSNGMTTFGLFQTAQTLTGQEATAVYAVRTSTYSGGSQYAAKVVVTPGVAITASTGAYVTIISTLTVGVATETAKIDSIVINWNEGSSARSATMAVYKNRLHYCAQSSSGTFNDVCFVLDRNGGWTKWSGVNARHLNVVNQNFVMGGSTEMAGGFIYKLYDTDSDDGNAISAFYESKDHVLGKIQNIKSVDRVYMVHHPDATTLTLGVNADGGLRSRSYDVDLSTNGAFGVKNKIVSSPLDGNTFRIRFSNNAASKPWEIQGYGISYQDKGLMFPGF